MLAPRSERTGLNGGGVRRWVLPLAATVAAGTLAAYIATSADQLASAAQPAAPRLATVSTASLAQMDVTLAPAPQAPYCRLQRDGLAPPGWGGCAVSREYAEAQAEQGRSRAVESALALVTMPGAPVVGRRRLAWL